MTTQNLPSKHRLNQLFAQANKRRIAVVGDLMLDTYISGTASRLSQEAPVPVLHVKKKEVRLGGAANVIRNLKSLAPKSEVVSIGVVGRDAPGTVLADLLKKENADVSCLMQDAERPTIEKQRVIIGTQQVVRMDFEEPSPLSLPLQKKLIDVVVSLIKGKRIDAVIVEDYAKGLVSQDLLDAVTKHARENDVFTSLDPHPRNPAKSFGFSLMTPNRSEAFSLAGMYCSDPVKVEKDMALIQVAANIMESWAPENLLITLGHQGMALFPHGSKKPFVIPTIAREVFDVSGAGDTVISTYTLFSVAGATPVEAALVSNQAAGIVVGKAGTAVTNRSELMKSFNMEMKIS